MTIDEIKELLRLFNESGVGELEVQRGEDRVRIRKSGPAPAMPQAPVVIAHPTTATPAPSAAQEPAPAAPVKAPESEAPEQVVVKSPIVGTFFEAPSPDAPPFVKVGDSVKVGQVLCIVEAMKLLNEINAEVAGTIAAKFVENGSPVEYGESLYAIEPTRDV